jgi:hypothetical protein
MHENKMVPQEVSDPASESPWARLEGLIHRLESAVGPLLSLPGIDSDHKEQFEAVLGLLKLACFYGRETTACLGAEAFFAANVMGAATLETLLLLMCIMKEESVRTTRTWQLVLKGKGKPLLKVLGKADLEKLLQIGDELAWFSDADIPKLFMKNLIQHFGPDASRTFSELVPRMSGRRAGDIARDARNKLHPAKLLREPFELSNTDGMVASLFLLLAFSSVVEEYMERETLGGK